MPNKKLIAITGPSASSQLLYDLIENLGFNFIFVNHNDKENLKEISEKCDALILAGGTDLYPPYYGLELMGGYGMESFDPKRDIREGFLFNQFNEQQKPIWGICRGFQKIAVEMGWANNFVLDLGFSAISHAPGREGMKLDKDIVDFAHQIHFFDQRESQFVNSLHHQGIKVTDSLIKNNGNVDFVAYAHTADKKPDLLEWFETENIMAQQFHPENNYKYCEVSGLIVNKFANMVKAGTHI